MKPPKTPPATPAPRDRPEGYKIFPRNLTARAEKIVTGNPANSRPESGVDNCYPGLEVDQRNLEGRFFPGLVFYYHRLDGVLLVEAPLTAEQRAAGLKPEDFLQGDRLYLWGMMGRHLVQESEPSMVIFFGQTGMEVWGRVHDLLPGVVAIVLGPKPGALPNLIDRDELRAVYDAAAAATPTSARKVVRSETGSIRYAILAEQRARYLTEDGVIDPQEYRAGDLTKTLCAPWMFDFRDCLCFYWSSNKPDIVDVEYEGKVQPYVNFLRRAQDRVGPPAPDTAYYQKTEGGETLRRTDLELSHKDMVEGWSHRLPVVLHDQESPDSTARLSRGSSAAAEYLTLDKVITELSYLATVEHALTVEYLYAYYSINARPPSAAQESGRSPGTDGNSGDRIADAAKQVMTIAVDEMRHFMWVNQALRMLGGPPSVGRAGQIGEPPNPARNGRNPLPDTNIKYLDQPFSLKPLSSATLDWFIEVEAPSKRINEGIDGMYVYILESLNLRKEEIAAAAHVIPLIKLIIDEGGDHWARFRSIKQTLEGISEAVYLRPLAPEPPGPAQLHFLDICDAYYQILFNAIELSVSLGWEQQPQLTEAAIRLMRNLDEMAVVTAAQGYLPRFEILPSVPKPAAQRPIQLVTAAAFQTRRSGDAGKFAATVDQLYSKYNALEATLRNTWMSGEREARLIAARHQNYLTKHVAQVDAILMQDLIRKEALEAEDR